MREETGLVAANLIRGLPLSPRKGFAATIARGPLKHLDERAPDDLAFAFRVGDSSQLAEKNVCGILVMQLDVEVLAEHALHAFGFALAQQTVVDKHAGELIADGFVNQRRRDAGIHTARQPENHAVFPDFSPDLLDRAVNERTHRPVPSAPADAVNEVGDDLLAVRCVMHFGMKLDAVQLARFVGDGGVGRVITAPDAGETIGQQRHLIAVTHPDLLEPVHAREQPRFTCDFEFGVTVFAFVALIDATAELVRHQLHPVADAERGNAQVPDRGIALRRVLAVHAGRAAAEDQTARSKHRQFRGGRVEVQDLGEHFALTDPPRDDLRVLRAEIQNDDLVHML